MSQHSSRREFIKTTTGISVLAATGLGFSGMSAHGQVPLSRKGGPKLKTGLNAYSFVGPLSPGADGAAPEMTLFDVLDFCAEHDIDSIDPTGYFFPGYPNVPSDKYIAKFKKRAFELGLDISGTGIRNNFASSDAAVRAADVQLAKDWIEAAAKLGAPVIRVFAGHEDEGSDREEVAKNMAEALRSCAEHGKKYGVLVGVQNHGDFLKTAEQTIRILEMVNSDWLGVILDTGNFHNDPYGEIAAVLPYAVNFQVKEGTHGKDRPEMLDLDRFIKIVRDANYRGYLPIETLTPTGATPNPLEAVPRFHAEVKAAIERAG